jgi:transcriptional regulator with XRE-family HTH domain
MAEKMRITRSTYRNYEENTEPDLATIRTIAAALEIPAWTLLKGIIEFTNVPENEKSGSVEPDYSKILSQVKQYANDIISLAEVKKAPAHGFDPGTNTGHLPTQGIRFSGKKRTDKKPKDK